MSPSSRPRPARFAYVARAALRRAFGLALGIAAGTACALSLLTALLMLAPRPLLGPTSYYDRLSPSATLHYRFYEADGDLFAALPGRVRPPAENRLLVDFTLAWDADGFRAPARPADGYPIAVFGDSFTEGFNVPLPYPDLLAERLGQSVRNYGYRAYGPLEVAQAIAEFAPRESRDWVIYGYFSGNDLGDLARGPKVDTRSPLTAWGALLTRLRPPAPAQPAGPDTHYDNPFPVIIGGHYYEMVFLPYYLSWHLLPDAGLAASRNYALLAESLARIDGAVAGAAGGSRCRALAFIPTKEQLYYRYIYPTERQWLRGVLHRPVVDADGFIRFVPAPLDEADEPAFLRQLYAQRDAVGGLVDSLGWVFIDLLPAFEAAVAEGALLYYPYDSHWNQAGHDLAAAAIADALRAAEAGGMCKRI